MSGARDPTVKIAIVVGQLAQGGTERQLYRFLKYCNRERWAPVVCVSGGPMGFWDDPIRELGISVTLLQGHPLVTLWQFRQFCKANGVQCVFSWSAHTNRYGLALLGLGIPCIGSFRNVFRPELWGRYARLRTYMSFAAVSIMVCNSQETAAAVRERVGDHKRVVYVPNSVQPIDDVELCRATWRQRLGMSQGEILILGVGRLTSQKNFARFIDAVACVYRAVPVQAVIAGRDDGCLKSLEQRAALSGLNPGVIRFIGAVPDARELVCAADVFMLSSDYEGMPNVILEAMAAGVPCVSTRVNGVSALIEHGVSGFIADHQADTLAERVLTLVRDGRLREEMGARALEQVKGAFDPEVIAMRLWKLCEQQCTQS